ncbi:MAG: transaldolase family protein [Clostridiales bacterium]|jgi:transaldolase|nr:transaldolase family protein [Clostridiales bacterium]
MAADNRYLKWLASTESCWWCDSASESDVSEALENGATGVTTNPLLISRSLCGDPSRWRPRMEGVDALEGDARAEEIIRRVTVRLAALLLPAYERTGGAQGFVCAQVAPSLAGDRDGMLEMALRLRAWAPNIAVKLPATCAGLDVIEECAAMGIPTVGTVSFTAAQAVAVAMRQHCGALRAERGGVAPAAAFAVLMVGRLDDYLRDVALDRRAPVEPGDILWAGTAAIKSAYREVRRAGFRSKLMPAGMRGAYHASALAGADMSMSIGPPIAARLMDEREPYSERVDEDVPADALTRLRSIPEFARSFEPFAMRPDEFIGFGATQKTLSQFVEAGWLQIKAFKAES